MDIIIKCFCWLDVEGMVSATCSESILFDWMVLESVDLSACLFLLVAGSFVYIIVVGKSLSTMSFYVFFSSLCLCFLSVFCWIILFTESALVVICHVINHHHVDLSWTAFTINLLFLLDGGASLIFVAGEQHKR